MLTTYCRKPRAIPATAAVLAFGVSIAVWPMAYSRPVRGSVPPCFRSRFGKNVPSTLVGPLWPCPAGIVLGACFRQQPRKHGTTCKDDGTVRPGVLGGSVWPTDESSGEPGTGWAFQVWDIVQRRRRNRAPAAASVSSASEVGSGTTNGSENATIPTFSLPPWLRSVSPTVSSSMAQ